mgnify:CR=1 FL=1
MAATIKGITIEIGANTTGLGKALEDVNKKARSLQSELKQVDSLLKLNPGNAELVAQKQELLARAVANAKEKLETLRAVQAQVERQFASGQISDEQYRAFTREVAKAEGEVNRFENELSQLCSTADRTDDKVADVGDKAQAAGRDMENAGEKAHKFSGVLSGIAGGIGKAAAAGIAGPPVVVGHSMGGFVTIATAALRSDDLAGVVVVDSPVVAPDPEVEVARAGQAFGVPRVYESRDQALERFRTVPPQENYLPYVMHHVARRSLREVEGGWSWKFHHNLFDAFTGSIRAVALPYLPEVRCRFALLRAENGLVTEDIGESMYEMLGRNAPVVELPSAGHHPMLDEPLVLTTAIRALLADWDHSEPRPPR